MPNNHYSDTETPDSDSYQATHRPIAARRWSSGAAWSYPWLNPVSRSSDRCAIIRTAGSLDPSIVINSGTAERSPADTARSAASERSTGSGESKSADLAGEEQPAHQPTSPAEASASTNSTLLRLWCLAKAGLDPRIIMPRDGTTRRHETRNGTYLPDLQSSTDA